MIDVISADDHPLVRAGLAYLFDKSNDINLAAEVDNGNDLLKCLRERHYDVAVVDIQMPGRNGIELITQIKREFPDLPVIVLSTHKEDMFALRTLKAGASGYICKDYTGTELVDAIHKVAAGQRYISGAVADLMASEINSPREAMVRHNLLSDREYQVFLMIAQGMTTSDIADKLSLSVKTVSTHKTRIKEKMKFSGDADFIHYALAHQLIESSPKA